LVEDEHIEIISFVYLFKIGSSTYRRKRWIFKQ